MDQRQQQPIEQRARLLPGKAAGQIDAAFIEEGDRTGHAVAPERHVGVEKEEDFVAGGLGQLPTGVLLAAPSGGKGRARHEPHARIGTGQRLRVAEHPVGKNSREVLRSRGGGNMDA